jgi:hypothetical protein
MTWRSPKGILVASGIAAVLVVSVLMARDGDVAPATAPVAGRTGASGRGSGSVPVSDLKLELLEQKRAHLGEPERDPFRFQARQPAPRPATATPPPPPSAPVGERPSVPAGPPPPPPIALRFIGLVDAPSQAGRLAILSDGRGNVVYGKEGDTIEGRYRLLKVGADSVELAYIDGRGRQTVRLSGQ